MTKTHTETGTGKRTAAAPSGDDFQPGGETELLVWNALVARPKRVVCARIPDPDDQAETKVLAGGISG